VRACAATQLRRPCVAGCRCASTPAAHTCCAPDVVRVRVNAQSAQAAQVELLCVSRVWLQDDLELGMPLDAVGVVTVPAPAAVSAATAHTHGVGWVSNRVGAGSDP
jgi:hypothetical protein